ncbi:MULTISPECIES: protealysin inhibitor emfourin [unclassified Microbacterium]|uniref:protealysin inhibitor emfourin n=1 Tax=unclassified Microbacterium TaxID=2609290 RepID=UPI00301A5217
MSESPPPTDAQVVIAVVRTGGIAGIRRQWRVEAEASDAQEWITLIDSCPWEQDTEAGSGADRFMWSIRTRTPSERRERELPDSALDGPWRTLVEAVRAAAA